MSDNWEDQEDCELEGTLKEGLAELEELRLDGCPKLTSTGLQVLFGSNPLLSILSLADVQAVDDQAVAALAGLPHLTDLDCSGCSQLTNQAVGSLCTASPLIRLGLARLPHLCDSAVVALSHLPQLTQLDLSWCPKVSSNAILMLWQHAGPQMQILSCQGCGGGPHAEMAIPPLQLLQATTWPMLAAHLSVVQVGSLGDLKRIAHALVVNLKNPTVWRASRQLHLSGLQPVVCIAVQVVSDPLQQYIAVRFETNTAARRAIRSSECGMLDGGFQLCALDAASSHMIVGKKSIAEWASEVVRSKRPPIKSGGPGHGHEW